MGHTESSAAAHTYISSLVYKKFHPLIHMPIWKVPTLAFISAVYTNKQIETRPRNELHLVKLRMSAQKCIRACGPYVQET